MKNHHGTTLVETLMGVLLMSLVGIGITKAYFQFTQAYHSTRLRNEMQMASHWAVYELDRIIALAGYRALPTQGAFKPSWALFQAPPLQVISSRTLPNSEIIVKFQGLPHGIPDCVNTPVTQHTTATNRFFVDPQGRLRCQASYSDPNFQSRTNTLIENVDRFQANWVNEMPAPPKVHIILGLKKQKWRHLVDFQIKARNYHA